MVLDPPVGGKLGLIRREMFPAEVARAAHLGTCRLPGASWVKRFARQMRARVLGPGPWMITERESARLLVECYRYRRQFTGLEGKLVPAVAPAGYWIRAMEAEGKTLAMAQAEFEAEVAAGEARLRALHAHRGQVATEGTENAETKEGRR
jgi:hypothetical protein